MDLEAIEHKLPQGSFQGILAPKGLFPEALKEAGGADLVLDRLLLKMDLPLAISWCANRWLNPQWIPIQSISDGAKSLRAIQRNWALFPYEHHRRAKLIEEQLPQVNAKPLQFLAPIPSAPLGSWTLVRPDLILASAHCSHPYANGEVEFIENKISPPSRAYLKLWELFTLYGFRPKAGERVMDLGSSPGGWTWVLSELGCQVISVDKAALENNLDQREGVHFLRQSAFSLRPEEIGPVDWLFSDLICYPEKLFRLVDSWWQSGLVKNLVVTIKFQGATDHEVLRKFLEIPGSRAVHLHCNKHELTWFLLSDQLALAK